MRLNNSGCLKVHTTMVRLAAFLLLTVLLASAYLPALAMGLIDVTRACSLTLSIDADITGMEVRVYKVADMTDDMRYVPVSGVRIPDGIDLNRVSGFDEWSELADRLCQGVESMNGTQARLASGKTKLQNLECGLYLVVTEDFTDGGYIYSAPAFLVAVPTKSMTSDASGMVYDVFAEIKFMRTPMRKKLMVRSRWFGETATEKRPDTVDVHLMRDGVLYKTLVLSNDNNWETEVDDIESNYQWTIVEEPVPEGFRTDYTQEVKPDMDVLIVDNYIDTNPEPTNEPQSTATPEPTVVPTVTQVPDTNPTPTPKPSNNTTTTESEKIPQTGMIMWPIYAMYGSAAVLALIGILLLLKSKGERRG